MVNPFEETLQAGIVNPREQAALSMRDAGIGSLSGRPDTTYMDNKIEEQEDKGGFLSRHLMNKLFQKLGKSHPYEGALPSPILPRLKKFDPRDYLTQPGTGIPGYFWNAGIPATDQGYRVQQAGGPFKGGYPLPGMDWLEKKLFGDPYAQDPPPVDEDNELLPGWELHQDGWHYFPPEFEGDNQDTMDQFMEDVGPEDLGVPETMEASGDSYNIMAGELMRSGLFDPVEIQNMDSYELQQNYENTFGSEGDATQMSRLGLNMNQEVGGSRSNDMNENKGYFRRLLEKIENEEGTEWTPSEEYLRGMTDVAKVNLQDVQDRIGGDINWNKFIRDLESREIEYGSRGGLMSLI